MITFKFEGKHNNKSLSPRNLPLKFLKEIISQLGGKLVPKNSTVSITEGSACLNITEEQKQEEQMTMDKIEEKSSLNEFIENAKNCSDKKKFNPTWNRHLKELREKIKDFDCDFSILEEGKKEILKIDKHTPILTDDDLWHETYKVIYGEIINIGGKEPNIHVKDEVIDKTIIVSTNRETIQQIKKNILYQKKSIYISCQINENNQELRKCQFIRWDEYNPEKLRNNFKVELKKMQDAHDASWDRENIEKNYNGDTDKWLSEVRYGE